MTGTESAEDEDEDEEKEEGEIEEEPEENEDEPGNVETNVKKTHYNNSVIVTVLLIEGIFILTCTQVYGQEQLQQQPASPSTSLSTDQPQNDG
jgi:hypothetical protein